MYKRLSILLILAALMFVTVNQQEVKAANEISVYVNGERLSFNQPPITQNGRTLVPLRGIFESLGATVQWNGSSQTIDVTRGNTRVWLKIGSKTTRVNGKNVTIEVPAQVRNGRTLVPLRFISESLGESVHWDAATRSVYIGTAPSTPSGKAIIRGISMGMTKQEVKRKETAYLAGEDPDALYYTNVYLFGFTGTLVYEFDRNNRLIQIYMLYPTSALTLDEAETVYYILLSELTNKFGYPDVIDTNWVDDPQNFIWRALWNGSPTIYMQVSISEYDYLTSPGILFSIK